MRLRHLLYFLFPAIVFVPLMVFAYQRGQDFGQIGLSLVSITILLFLILIWSERAISEYRHGLKLKAAFSAAVVFFLTAMLYQSVRTSLEVLLMSDTAKPGISERAGE